MKIYLAARYSRHAEMQGVRDVLEAFGHEVTSRWIEAPAGRYGRGSFTREQLAGDPGYCAAVAYRDIEDMEAAEAMLCFTEEDGGGKGGRHVEFGWFLASGKRVIIVGPRENVFHTHPAVVWYPDWSQFVIDWSLRHRLP